MRKGKEKSVEINRGAHINPQAYLNNKSKQAKDASSNIPPITTLQSLRKKLGVNSDKAVIVPKLNFKPTKCDKEPNQKTRKETGAKPQNKTKPTAKVNYAVVELSSKDRPQLKFPKERCLLELPVGKPPIVKPPIVPRDFDRSLYPTFAKLLEREIARIVPNYVAPSDTEGRALINPEGLLRKVPVYEEFTEIKPATRRSIKVSDVPDVLDSVTILPAAVKKPILNSTTPSPNSPIVTSVHTVYVTRIRQFIDINDLSYICDKKYTKTKSVLADLVLLYNYAKYIKGVPHQYVDKPHNIASSNLLTLPKKKGKRSKLGTVLTVNFPTKSAMHDHICFHYYNPFQPIQLFKFDTTAAP